jgi:uncharacterized protein YggE
MEVNTRKGTWIQRKRLARIAMLCLVLSAVSQAQTLAPTRQDAADAPEIVASGIGEVSAAPTKAEFAIEVKTLAATAAAASAENARLSRAVTDALRAAGVRSEEVVSTQLSVGANWSFDESSRRQKRTAYQTINRIQMQTEQLDKVAVYVDVALSAGATGVTTATYFAKDPEAMRRQALIEAVAAARRDAEAMAQAGGGRLGDLELLTTEQPESVFSERMDRMFKKSVPEEGTEIVAPEITASARVIARWRFLPTASGK